MLKYILLFLFGFCRLTQSFAQTPSVSFTSTDKKLEEAFAWAKQMALHYKGSPADSVGPWYESALPPRFAFCMRDVSHQSIGGEILGLSTENKNMLTVFARNVSESKNWCSYWEINRRGLPAPEDYRNDTAFWYNLNANFDVMYACWRLYLWTGDENYLNSPVFTNFYQKSVNEYIDAWYLNAGQLLTRPAHPNAPVPFNVKDDFYRCRGLPSYSEGVPDMKMGIDLVAALYRGMVTWANILDMQLNAKGAEGYWQKALAYQQQLDARWWDGKAGLYNTCYSNGGKFEKDEGETFLLWFDVLKDSARKRKTIEHIISSNLNVENQSYLPYLMYKNGYWDNGYSYLLHLADPFTKRREYPEVSYGVVEGIVQGLMGADANAPLSLFSTLYRGKREDTCQLAHLPVLHTFVTVEHFGAKRTMLMNEGGSSIIWKAQFAGAYKVIYMHGKPSAAKHEKDWQGNVTSFVQAELGPGVKAEAAVE